MTPSRTPAWPADTPGAKPPAPHHLPAPEAEGDDDQPERPDHDVQHGAPVVVRGRRSRRGLLGEVAAVEGVARSGAVAVGGQVRGPEPAVPSGGPGAGAGEVAIREEGVVRAAEAEAARDQGVAVGTARRGRGRRLPLADRDLGGYLLYRQAAVHPAVG